jgi:magnesium transporter
MPENTGPKPWIAIQELVDRGDPEQLDGFLDTLKPGDVARAISRLDDRARGDLLTILEPEDAADLMEELSDVQGAELIDDISVKQAAAIVDEMDSDHRADLLGELDEGDAEAILQQMDPEEAQEARELLQYDPETAGGIMVTEFVVYNQSALVSDVLNDLQSNRELYSDIGVQYAYVQTENKTLIGVLRLRDLVLSANDRPIAEVMVVNPVSVLASAPLDEIEQLFDRYMFYGIPVIEEDGHIVGVVERADAEEAHSERSERTFMRFSGIIGGEELREMALPERTSRRLIWLAANLVLSALAALVIFYYHETIEEIIWLAALIPVLVNVSGCSGNQAVAVSIRELALGLIKPGDFARVVRQEVAVGIINGLSLGVLLGIFTALCTRDPALSVVVGLALALNTVLAVALGGAIPLLLRRINIDPAAAAAPMLTTVVDVCGFFLILSLATAFLL